jgi:hypothetical protein
MKPTAQNLTDGPAKPTSGPWQDGPDNIDARRIAPYIKIDSENDGIAYVFGNTPAQRRANAKLIAAAPELLEIVRILNRWQKGADSIHFCALVGKEDGDTLGKLVSDAIKKVYE